jgi:HD-GYP domain-containing protein (c-di-GMP phosphodiesterase class II)
MPGKLRMIIVMIVSQAVCLLFGLWLQDQFLVAAAGWRSEQMAAAEGVPATGIRGDAILREMTISRVLGFVWVCGLQSIVAYLLLARLTSEHFQRVQQSEEESLLRAKDLVRTRDAVIFGLAKLAESRDPDTGHHLERIAMYSTRLSAALRRDPRFRGRVNPTFVRTIGISSALHDIGKVGVEDAVLLKPGRLDKDERFRMQLHTTLGGECIRQIEQRLGNSNFLEMAREIAFCHHERWDGAGYPVGLRGEEIPLAARIVAIADVYDALASRRVYKEAYPHEQCVEIIRRESGQQFDPDVVDVFLAISDQFREIAQRFMEPQTDFVSPTFEVEAGVDLSKQNRLTAEQARLVTETAPPEAFREPGRSDRPVAPKPEAVTALARSTDLAEF